MKLKAIHSIQQYYFQSLVFLFFLCFLVLESRCNNLSKTFSYVSFSGILSNRPLKPIYNPSIFAWLTSALRVSAFNSLENCFQLFNMFFLSDYIYFTTLVSTIAFSPFWKQQIFDFVDKNISWCFCRLFTRSHFVVKTITGVQLCQSLFTTFYFVSLWCCFMSLKGMLYIRL